MKVGEGHTCHSMYADVRVQHSGVVSLLSPMWYQVIELYQVAGPRLSGLLAHVVVLWATSPGALILTFKHIKS